MMTANIRDAVLIAGIYVYLAMRVVLPDWLAESIHIPCLLKVLTGHGCIGCGLPSAIISLLRGQIDQALDQNPLAPAVLIALLLTSLGVIKANTFKGAS